MDPKRKALSETVQHFKTKGQFEQYSGLEAMRRMKWERQQHAKNREAEEAHVRKHVWGYEGNNGNSGGDEMAEEFVNFGEINNQHLAPPRSILPAALVASSLLIGSLGGIAAYVTSQDDNAPGVPTMTDETVRLRLGRIEDYEQGND